MRRSEEELAFGPLSFLEYVSERFERAPDGGRVMVVRVRLSANLTGMTLEERIQQRGKVLCARARIDFEHTPMSGSALSHGRFLNTLITPRF